MAGGDPFEAVPALSPGCGLYPLGNDRVLVVAPAGRTIVSGAGQGAVVGLIDGQRTTRAIAAALADEVPAPVVLFALDRLRRAGWITDRADSAGVDQRAMARAVRRAGGVAGEAWRVAIEAEDEALAAEFARGLAAFDVLVDPGARHVLVLVDGPGWPGDPSADRRAALEGRLRAADRRWLPVCPTGARWWFGPALGTAGGPCWVCLADRLRFNQPVHRWLVEQGHQPPQGVVEPAAVHTIAALLAPALMRWVEGGEHAFDGALVALDPFAMQTSRHRVVRRPQCPGCGDPALLARRAERPIVLASRPVAFSADGGHRIQSPDATWRRLEHHISPLTGVIASLGPMPGRDHALRPVFAAVSPVCPRDPAPRRGAWRQPSMGKGETPAQARASVLGEAIERYAVFWQGDEPRRRATAAELGPAAVRPAALQNFSAKQLAHPGPVDGDPRRPRGSVRVPAPVDGQTPLWWTPAWSLTAGRRRWLPTAWCYRETPFEDDRRYLISDSNGRAAGNCLEEAILQGFLELVERDATAIWWANRVARPAIDLAAFDAPRFDALRRHYAEQGWQMWVLDLTHDLGIPVCAALARDADDRWCIGLGCHLDARLAVSRALTELGQLFDPSPERLEPWPAAAMPSVDFLLPGSGIRRPSDFEPLARADLRDAVELCIERAARAGLETIALDLSRPDIDLAVALVAVPGLRHFWPRHGPGRLYSVPVEMGWRSAPLTEAELNPVRLIL